MLFKDVARKPVLEVHTYAKYGFVIVEHDIYLCPQCGKILNAGPNYQPQYCDQCGQRVTFADIEWKEDRQEGYASAGRKVNEYEPV